MRVAWFEVGLASFAVACAAAIGLALQREDPATWGTVAAALLAGRIALR
ncbi:MAG: hypothetical protein KatS3mg060_0954 [Dehalococcoidia bacterium]|nr:MAG: hypothetical protein KatS3mg060_0954 [Dehalococcoidia bacterium]